MAQRIRPGRRSSGRPRSLRRPSHSPPKRRPTTTSSALDPEAAVDRLLDWLAAHNYLSETRFVESRVNARSRKQGTLRIKLELSRHGLALEPEQAAALRETEFARAQALWQRKFGELARRRPLRAKQARFLAARGFAADVVRRVVGGEERVLTAGWLRRAAAARWPQRRRRPRSGRPSLAVRSPRSQPGDPAQSAAWCGAP